MRLTTLAIVSFTLFGTPLELSLFVRVRNRTPNKVSPRYQPHDACYCDHHCIVNEKDSLASNALIKGFEGLVSLLAPPFAARNASVVHYGAFRSVDRTRTRMALRSGGRRQSYPHLEARKTRVCGPSRCRRLRAKDSA